MPGTSPPACQMSGSRVNVPSSVGAAEKQNPDCLPEVSFLASSRSSAQVCGGPAIPALAKASLLYQSAVVLLRNGTPNDLSPTLTLCPTGSRNSEIPCHACVFAVRSASAP